MTGFSIQNESASAEGAKKREQSHRITIVTTAYAYIMYLVYLLTYESAGNYTLKKTEKMYKN